MFLHKVATLAAVAVAQYADYNYFDIADVAKQQISANSPGSPHTNGRTCDSCIGLDYGSCVNVPVSCEGEQFHCYVVEKRHFGTLFYVEKGCKQDLACHNEFNLNDRSVSGVDIKGSPLKQCYGDSTSADVSICRQCCSNISSNNCNSAFDATHAATYSNWQATGNHDFSHLYSADGIHGGNTFHNGK